MRMSPYRGVARGAEHAGAVGRTGLVKGDHR